MKTELKNGPPWVVGPNKEKLYLDDDIRTLKSKDKGKGKDKVLYGIAEKTFNTLNKKGIKNIKDLLESDAKDEKWEKLKLFAISLQPDENKPPVKDHKKEENPYQSLYKDKWRDVIADTKFMKKYVCITSILKHIISESGKIMKGTIHENNWHFYHDALSLMTSAETKEWMKNEGILD